MRRSERAPAGMLGFTVIALGQFVSMLGTGMTRFAITIYAWQVTGEATALALVGFFAFGPSVLLSPIAGAIVDRANRKLVMMLSDLAAGLMTLTGRLGWLLGTGPGSGMALIILMTALMGVGVGLVGYLVPRIRDVETLLPDHDAPRAAEAVPAAAG